MIMQVKLVDSSKGCSVCQTRLKLELYTNSTWWLSLRNAIACHRVIIRGEKRTRKKREVCCIPFTILWKIFDLRRKWSYPQNWMYTTQDILKNTRSWFATWDAKAMLNPCCCCRWGVKLGKFREKIVVGGTKFYRWRAWTNGKRV